MTVDSVLSALRECVAAERLVARDWRAYSDLDELLLTVEFTFYCPCGNDIKERIVVPHPSSPAFYGEMMISHACDALVRELLTHLEGE